jgi:hypothetical protein
MRHGELSNRVHFLKKEKKGVSKMCKITEGIFEDGRKEGLSKGQERMNRLIEHLMQDNRQDDLLRSVNDPAYQEELMQEYGLHP